MVPSVGPEPPSETSSLVLAASRRRDAPAPEADRLPSERRLAEGSGAPWRAVRRALEAEGLIRRRWGRGSSVGPEPPRSLDIGGDPVERTDLPEIVEARAPRRRRAIVVAVAARDAAGRPLGTPRAPRALEPSHAG